MIGPPGRSGSDSEYVKRALIVDCRAVRSVRSPTPAGRSLRNPSWLSSVPVVQLYGKPSLAFQIRLTVTFLNCVLVSVALMRYGMSAGPGPHSVSGEPLG